MPDTPTLDLSAAFRIAVEFHGGQRDLQGEPYLFHVMRVAESMSSDEYRVVAILHDVIEDAGMGALGVTHEIYREYGVTIGDAVVALTRLPDERYLDYIRRVAAHNPLAVKVKFADLADNRDRKRLRKLPREESDRLWDKYEEAWHVLYAAADAAGTLPKPFATSRPTAEALNAVHPGVISRCASVSGQDQCVLPLGHHENHFGGGGRSWDDATPAESPKVAV